jgi:pimeloyl-ACP methyl ester carboxylesterase
LEKAAARPGFSLLATEDRYVRSEEIRAPGGRARGARTEVLEGLGHWSMVQEPGLSAAVLTRFWDSLN